LAALLIGTWLLAVGGNAGGAITALEDAPIDNNANNANHDSNLAPAEGPQAPAAEPTTAEAKGVPVTVHSDVEDAVLLVNGEPHGPLVTSQGQALELPPGAYKFEAQSKGNTAAVEVVNVRPDAPVDVFLRLPAGANGPAKPGATGQAEAAPKPAEAPSQAPAEAAPAAPPSEPAKPQASAAAEPKAAPATPTTPGPLSAPGGHAAPRKKEVPRAPAAAAPKAPAPAAPEKPAAAPEKPAAPAPSEPKPDSPIPDNPF
jgi:hypothetical protein